MQDIKNNLMTSLGDDWDRYLNYLKKWFRGKLTKEEFDKQTRYFLTKQQIFFHNKFILEILKKVECVDSNSVPTVAVKIKTEDTQEVSHSSSKKRKKTTQYVFEQQAFHPYSNTDFVREVDSIKDPSKVSYNNTNVPTLRYAAQELFLSDFSLVMGRFVVGAWECGLNSVDDVATEMVVSAVQTILKNILSNCIRKRKSFKITSEANYYYDVGAPLKDPTIRNTISRKKTDDNILDLSSKELTPSYMTRRYNDDSLFLAAYEDNSQHEPKRRISLLDIYNTLMDSNVIMSHNVHAIALEKIVSMMT